MPEQRFCLNCNYIGPMTVHGECSTCGSESIVLAEYIPGSQAGWAESVMEAYRIYGIPDYEPDYRDEEGYTDNKAELAQWWNKI